MTKRVQKKQYTAPLTEILLTETDVCLLRGSWGTQSANPTTSTVEDGIYVERKEGESYGEAIDW